MDTLVHVYPQTLDFTRILRTALTVSQRGNHVAIHNHICMDTKHTNTQTHTTHTYIITHTHTSIKYIHMHILIRSGKYSLTMTTPPPTRRPFEETLE